VSQQSTNRAFDDLARALAEGSISRRRALKLFAGTALAALIPSRALAQQQKVTICHKPGTPDEKTLRVPESALGAHLGHGDTRGPCESTTTTTTPTTSTSTSTSSTTSTSTSTTTTTPTTSTSTSTTSTTPICRPNGSSCMANDQCCSGTCFLGTNTCRDRPPGTGPNHLICHCPDGDIETCSSVNCGSVADVQAACMTCGSGPVLASCFPNSTLCSG
jgi:hypothetical protein